MSIWSKLDGEGWWVQNWIAELKMVFSHLELKGMKGYF